MLTNYKEHQKSKLQLVTEEVIGTSWEYQELYRGTPDTLAIEAAVKKFVGDYKEHSKNYHTMRSAIDDNDIQKVINITLAQFNYEMALVVVGFGLLHNMTDGGRTSSSSSLFDKTLKILARLLDRLKDSHDDVLKYDARYSATNPLIVTYISERMYMDYMEKIYIYFILHQDNKEKVKHIQRLYRGFHSLFLVEDEWAESDDGLPSVNISHFSHNIGDVLTYFSNKMNASTPYVGGVRGRNAVDVNPIDSKGNEYVPGSINKLIEITKSISESYDFLEIGRDRKKPLKAVMLEATVSKISKEIDKNIQYYRSLNV